jgi:hypothetical protein
VSKSVSSRRLPLTEIPGIMSLIQQLYLVAWTPFNTLAIRTFAVEQLRNTASTTGILQAALLAETARKTFGNPDLISPVPWP